VGTACDDCQTRRRCRETRDDDPDSVPSITSWAGVSNWGSTIRRHGDGSATSLSVTENPGPSASTKNITSRVGPSGTVSEHLLQHPGSCLQFLPTTRGRSSRLHYGHRRNAGKDRGMRPGGSRKVGWFIIGLENRSVFHGRQLLRTAIFHPCSRSSAGLRVDFGGLAFGCNDSILRQIGTCRIRRLPFGTAASMSSRCLR